MRLSLLLASCAKTFVFSVLVFGVPLASLVRLAGPEGVWRPVLRVVAAAGVFAAVVAAGLEGVEVSRTDSEAGWRTYLVCSLAGFLAERTWRSMAAPSRP